jgi:hypothetical protein
MTRELGAVLIVGAALAGAGACASNPARSSVVPLEIPEPPPRVTMAPLPAAEPPAEAVPVPASRPTATLPAPSPPRNATTSPAPPAAQPPAVPVAETPPAAAPPRDLLPAGPAGRTPTVGQVRDTLTRTKQKLDQIDRRRLNTGKQADFDSARRFLAQAETAMNANNLMLAESSAEKAETLANGLR